MTIRQFFLKLFYPVLIKLSKKNNTMIANEMHPKPTASLYDLVAEVNNGNIFFYRKYRGKNILIVNTASNCGYTNQYKELQELYQKFSDKLEIIAYPSNDFKEQEPGGDRKIANFCQRNFGVTFPIIKKSVVLKSEKQNIVYKWLTNASLNGWNNQEPSWNFSKYFINSNGELVAYFDPAISPLDDRIIKLIN